MSCVAFAAGGDSLVNRSLVGGVDLAMMSPLITSHILRILVVDWIWLSHNPKFGPSRVGMQNLLISMSVYSFCLCASGFFIRNGLTLFQE